MECPDQCIDEEILQAVVNTFKGPAREPAQIKSEVFCYSCAFHPPAVNGKHHARVECGDVPKTRLLCGMSSEQVKGHAHLRSEADRPPEGRAAVLNTGQVFVPEVEFDQLIRLLDASAVGKFQVKRSL